MKLAEVRQRVVALIPYRLRPIECDDHRARRTERGKNDGEYADGNHASGVEDPLDNRHVLELKLLQFHVFLRARLGEILLDTRLLVLRGGSLLLLRLGRLQAESHFDAQYGHDIGAVVAEEGEGEGEP